MMKSKWFIVVTLFLACLTANWAWAGSIKMDGSTTVLPIAQKAMEAYMKGHPEVSISVSGGGSGNGIKAIIDGTTDIGNSSRFIKDEEVKAAVEKGAYPVPFAVAYDCIVPGLIRQSRRQPDAGAAQGHLHGEDHQLERARRRQC